MSGQELENHERHVTFLIEKRGVGSSSVREIRINIVFARSDISAMVDFLFSYDIMMDFQNECKELYKLPIWTLGIDRKRSILS